MATPPWKDGGQLHLSGELSPRTHGSGRLSSSHHSLLEGLFALGSGSATGPPLHDAQQGASTEHSRGSSPAATPRSPSLRAIKFAERVDAELGGVAPQVVRSSTASPAGARSHGATIPGLLSSKSAMSLGASGHLHPGTSLNAQMGRLAMQGHQPASLHNSADFAADSVGLPGSVGGLADGLARRASSSLFLHHQRVGSRNTGMSCGGGGPGGDPTAAHLGFSALFPEANGVSLGMSTGSGKLQSQTHEALQLVLAGPRASVDGHAVAHGLDPPVGPQVHPPVVGADRPASSSRTGVTTHMPSTTGGVAIVSNHVQSATSALHP